MKLSIVATLYQSATYVEEFCRRSAKVAKELVGEDYEIVLVNDGSPDNSLEIAITEMKKDSHLRIVDLSRNFGHHKAMMTGLAQARGDLVFLIDSDLEEEPEWLLSFARQRLADGSDVVFGVQEERKGSIGEKFTGKVFWRLFNLLTGMKLPENITTARLMTRRFINALLRHEEREVFMAGLLQITGFQQTSQIVRKHSSSVSTYTFWKKVSLLVNSVTSFSNAPLAGIFYFGAAISFGAGFYLLYLILHWAFFDKPLVGWTSVMASIWLLGGLMLSSVGVVGIYLSKIFSETKRRPYTIIRQVYERVGSQ